MRIRSAFLSILVVLGSVFGAAAQSRDVAITENIDYFGFDLQTERNVTLDQCSAVCIADPQCRAFTYNRKAQWCFLKSDFAEARPFAGAVGGRVVSASAEPDLGAPPMPSFLPAHVADEAIRYRGEVAAQPAGQVPLGAAELRRIAAEAALSGNAREASAGYMAALRLEQDDPDLWIALSRATAAIENDVNGDLSRFRQIGTSAALSAYQLTRNRTGRAEALAVLAEALAKRSMPRPALESYKASLELMADAQVQSAFEALRAREGFRVVDHTVEADAASPRICTQFSEDLVKSGVSYESFVTLDGVTAPAIEAKGRQICVEGLQHGQRYRVGLRSGLPSAVGETLIAPVSLDIYVRDRAASARFTGDGFVLPSRMRRGLPLVTVNADAADVEIFRIGERALPTLVTGYNFLRQLDGYDAGRIAEESGERVWTGKVETAGARNAEVTTSFPIDEALPDRKPGIYVMTARPAGATGEAWESRATQWFMVSDIGLSTFAGQDGLTVFARSLDTAEPIGSVELTLLSRNNEILGTAEADASGKAVFSPGLTRGTAALAPAVLTAKTEAGDFVFLDMTRAGFDLSDRGVEGRPAAGAIDVLAWSERGIYRAGETVHVSALARDDRATALDDLPLTFVFTRPDGREERRFVSAGAELGGHAVALDLPGNAMRGTWQMRVQAEGDGPALATTMFLVEDFVPDRIEFDLTAEESTLVQGQPGTATVAGRFLYGAPASDMDLEGELRISAVRQRPGLPGFSFGLADEEGQEPRVAPLTALDRTDASGAATIPLDVGELPATTRPLQAELVVRMREAGGRAVERRLTLPIQPDAPMIGIRPEFEGDALEQGATARFQVVGVGPDGQRTDLDGIGWSLVKIERNYQWYRSGSSWAYEPVTFTSEVANGSLDLDQTGSATIAVPVEWGRYRLEVASDDAEGPATSVEFDAGWYVEARSTETPDGLEVALDRERYATGETAQLRITPQFAGEVLVTVGGDRLLWTTTASVPEDGATIDIPVDAEWGAGAYVTATLFRPGSAAESRMPMRAVGLAWLGIDPAGRRLALTLDAPDRAAPRNALQVPLSIGNLEPGEDAYVTVAAVDVGILNLTRYQAPSPSAWYFGQRGLGIEMRDLYGRLIDGSLGTTGRLRTGGDGARMASEGSPPTEALVAFFSGIVKVDAQGRAAVSFDIPQFNGTVRLMAVAWSSKGVGEASMDVVIRDPVVVTASLPRFMAPGDETRLRLDIANTDGPAGDYLVEVTPSEHLSSAGSGARSATIAQSARASIEIPVSAVKTGMGRLAIRVSSPGGPSVSQEVSVDVRPGALPVTTRQVVALSPGASLRVDGGLLSGSILAGASVSVGVSAMSAFDVPSLLLSLDRYPYGCAEQTTSRALPLLYLSDLSAGSPLGADANISERIDGAIARVLGYQASSGSFGLWSPGSGDLWLDAYVTDFLTRAREKSYEVPQAAFRIALDNLRNSLAYDVDIAANGSAIAYALYVLARNGEAALGDLRYYTDTQLDAFENALARAHLAAALALYGDGPRAERVFASALAFAEDWQIDLSRSDYGSELRDGAAMLALAAETKPAPTAIPAMVRYVSETRVGQRALSTQEQAWMLLAARALAERNRSTAIDVDGAPQAGGWSTTLAGEVLEAQPVTIVNRGSAAVDAVVTAVAAPTEPLPAGGDGFSIERTYYRLDGTPANVTEAVQNERFVVVLSMTETNAWPSRVVVSDLLPAGFEIDNPRIVGSAELGSFSWLGEAQAAHSEFRSDRFIAAFDRTEESPRSFQVAYVVRAVSPGEFTHPAAVVEDMYRPEFQARTATGSLRVVTARP